jgi:glycosyltransferase involved in cell wall biosynthesis
MEPLKLDVVIATRNRRDALELSIPLLLSQSRKPERLIVVDSSDDPEAIESVVRPLADQSPVPIELIRSSPGSALQRNVGLSRVSSDVVFFPDDDSLVSPNALEALMRIYELDAEGVIGGVCTAEARRPPETMMERAITAYRMSLFDRFKLKIGTQHRALEAKLMPSPFILHGQSCWNVRPAPSWLERENAVLVEWMTGFRMSFRTQVIRRSGFDETLGRYALFEDVDASFSVMKDHLVVGTHNAQTFHHKAPGRRDSGRTLGVSQILNRAYVTCRHAAPGSAARAQLTPYSRYKVAQYAVGATSRFGRDKFIGASRAVRYIPELLRSPSSELRGKFLELRDHCLG